MKTFQTSDYSMLGSHLEKQARGVLGERLGGIA